MNEENLIKAISPQTCPNCKATIMVDLIFSPPAVMGLLSEEDVKNARQKARERIMKIGLPLEREKAAYELIDDPTFLFSESDIDTILMRFADGV